MGEMGPNDPNCPPILGKLPKTSSLVFGIDFVLMESLKVGEFHVCTYLTQVDFSYSLHRSEPKWS